MSESFIGGYLHVNVSDFAIFVWSLTCVTRFTAQLRSVVPRLPAAPAGVEGVRGLGGRHGGQHRQGGRDGATR